MASSLSAAIMDSPERNSCYPRRKLPIRVRKQGAITVLDFTYENTTLGIKQPMTSFAASPLGTAILELIDCYRSLEDEVSPLLRQRDELIAETARLRAQVDSHEGSVRELKGQLNKKGGR